MATLETELMDAFRSGLAKAVQDKLTGYSSPLEKLLAGIVEAQSGDLRVLLTDSVTSALSDKNFRETIATAVRTKLAKTLIERFGGEMEKQINLLKSDPVTRAKITLAIEEVVRNKIA